MTFGTTPEGGGDLTKEAIELRHCRRAFLLLASGLLLSLFAFVYAAVDGDATEQTPPLRTLAFGIGILGLAIIPGAVILLRCARSSRWRQGGAWLAALALIDIVVLAFLTTGWVRGAEAVGAATLSTRLLIETSAIIGWLELWWIAVLVAEFARACRAERMVRQTERLGGCVIVGLSIAVLHAGWSTPNMDAAASDGVGTSLGLLGFLLLLAAQLWTLQLLSSSALLARLLAERASARRRDTGE